jgi:hypothetical protein
MLNTSYTIIATLPVGFIWSRTTVRCFLLLRAWHFIHHWGLLSIPQLGESSLVGINLQPTIALLLSLTKKDWPLCLHRWDTSVLMVQWLHGDDNKDEYKDKDDNDDLVF